jgi:predicted MFS family arabinose efflux permease
MRESELMNHSGLLISACLGVICSSIVLPFYSIGVFVIPITTEFGWSRAEFQLAILFSTGTGILTAPVVGMLIEKFGARIVALVGLVGLSAAFLFAATTSSLWQLYAAYTLMALLGAGTIPVTWTTAVTAQFESQRGFALGLVLSGTGLCAVLIPPVVAFITETWGWRMAYIFLACLPVFVSGPVVFRWFWPPGESKGKEHAAASVEGLSLPEAMRGYRFWVLLVSIFLVYIAMSGMVPNLIPALTDAGIAATDAARAISVFGVAVIVGRLTVGYLVDSLWAPGVAFVAICLPVAGSLLLVDISSFHLAMFAAFLLGLAAGAELDLMSFLAAKYFGLLHYPRIYAWMYAALALASGIAPMLFAWVFDQTKSYDIGFMVGSGCFMIGAVMLLMLGRYPRWQR